ncbi:MAG: response regulator [Pirellulaceae bacterium]
MITPNPAEMEIVAEDEQHLAISLPNMRVLLVDDGDENRQLMSLILEEAGTTYRTAENGLEAVQLATEQEWDVILMDMQMPVMDGYTATRTLRAQGYHKPIIALTAHAMQQAEQECRDAGCSGFMTKPINFDRLIATLAEIAGIAVETTAKTLTLPDCEPVAAEVREHDDEPIVSTLPLHKERFRVIVEQFASTLDERFDALESALMAGDTRTLAELSHSLKGASGNCGFSSLAEVAALLERSAQSSELETAPQVLDQLRQIRNRIVTPRSADATHIN